MDLERNPIETKGNQLIWKRILINRKAVNSERNPIGIKRKSIDLERNPIGTHADIRRSNDL